MEAANELQSRQQCADAARKKYHHAGARRDLDNNVGVLLESLGIPKHIKGYEYLMEAIILAAANYHSIQKSLYTDVAKKYNTTASQVANRIHYAIGIAWQQGGLAASGLYFDSRKLVFHEKPTNLELIASIALHLVLREEAVV